MRDHKSAQQVRILVSAGEASGDYYASGVTAHLAGIFPHADFYGCAGPRLQALGVRPVVDAAQLGVVGLAEVVSHLPRIYGEFRKLVRYARTHPPDAAVLSDNPDFNLRLAAKLKALGVPVFYVVAPQVWAWRQGRVRNIRRVVDHLFCIFPFEETWFNQRGVPTTYIGHPMATSVRPHRSAQDFRQRYRLPPTGDLITLLPGSRNGEALRHLPCLLETAAQLQSRDPSRRFILAMPQGFTHMEAARRFREPIARQSIKIVENDTSDSIAHASVALAASGTVTIEAAMLGTPTVTFYRVNPLTWWIGRRLVKVPYFSMVNLVANRRVIPEFIQHQMTASHLADAAEHLLQNPPAAALMRQELMAVRTSLTRTGDPFERAASAIASSLSLPQETIRK